MSYSRLNNFLKNLRQRNIVCLKEHHWFEFYKFFKDKLQEDVSFPTSPILSGLGSYNDFRKRKLFEWHIGVVNQYFGFNTLEEYFSGFLEDDFHQSEYIDPSELSPHEESIEFENETFRLVFPALEAFEKLIILEPELNDEILLSDMLTHYALNTSHKRMKEVPKNLSKEFLLFQIYSTYNANKSEWERSGWQQNTRDPSRHLAWGISDFVDILVQLGGEGTEHWGKIL